jgi:hypothetical protein
MDHPTPRCYPAPISLRALRCPRYPSAKHDDALFGLIAVVRSGLVSAAPPFAFDMMAGKAVGTLGGGRGSARLGVRVPLRPVAD